MPAVYAHRRFGEMVLEALPPDLQKKFQPQKTSCFLGFEGPDILFYHKPFKANDTKKKGSEMHHRSAESFFIESARKIVNQDVDDVRSTAMAAYIAGFICHFACDNACHPLVFKLQDTGVAHSLIESEFDKYIMRLDGSKVFGDNPAKNIKNKNDTAKAAAEILEVKTSEIKRSILTLRTLNGVFVSRMKFLHKFAHWLLKKLNMENHFGGMLVALKDNERCQEIATDLYNRLKAAVQPTAELIEEYFSNLETIAQTGVVNKVFDKDYKGEPIV